MPGIRPAFQGSGAGKGMKVFIVITRKLCKSLILITLGYNPGTKQTSNIAPQFSAPAQGKE
jgi:hypothetical protein